MFTDIKTTCFRHLSDIHPTFIRHKASNSQLTTSLNSFNCLTN